MDKIIVENGDWDAARAKLDTVLNRNKAAFNAQFDATFGAPKAAGTEPAAAVLTKTVRFSSPGNPAPVQAAAPVALPKSAAGKLQLPPSSRR